jgi:hypothetical protein
MQSHDPFCEFCGAQQMEEACANVECHRGKLAVVDVRGNQFYDTRISIRWQIKHALLHIDVRPGLADVVIDIILKLVLPKGRYNPVRIPGAYELLMENAVRENQSTDGQLELEWPDASAAEIGRVHARVAAAMRVVSDEGKTWFQDFCDFHRRNFDKNFDSKRQAEVDAEILLDACEMDPGLDLECLDGLGHMAIYEELQLYQEQRLAKGLCGRCGKKGPAVCSRGCCGRHMVWVPNVPAGYQHGYFAKERTRWDAANVQFVLHLIT